MSKNDFFEGLTSASPHRGTLINSASGARLGRGSGCQESMYVNWFLEDVAKSLPYGLGSQEGFQLSLEPENRSVQELVLNALPAHTYGHTRLTEAFRQFLVYTVFDVVRGHLYLEVEYFYKDGGDKGKPVAFKVHVLPRGSVFKRFGKYRLVDGIGSEVPDEAGHVRKAVLDPKNLVVVSLPSPWARRALRTMSLLSDVSSQMSVATDFLTGEYGHNSGFDYNAHRDLVNDLVLKRTRDIGWAGRDTFLEGMLDPEKAWRAIQFARFQIVVRDTVLAGLQEAVDRAGRAIGYTAKFELQGTLDSANLDEFEADLQSGKRGIYELIHPALRSTPKAKP